MSNVYSTGMNLLCPTLYFTLIILAAIRSIFCCVTKRSRRTTRNTFEALLSSRCPSNVKQFCAVPFAVRLQTANLRSFSSCEQRNVLVKNLIPRGRYHLAPAFLFLRLSDGKTFFGFFPFLQMGPNKCF